MEIAQISKSTYNNQLQPSIYLRHKRNMSQTYTCSPQPMTHPRIKFLNLIVSEIMPRLDFKGQGHYSKANQGHTMMLPNHKL